MSSSWEDNPEFWRSAYQSHGGAILSYLKVRTPTQEDAEDILQETFVKGIHAASSLTDITKIRSFLFAIAHNQLVNTLRNKKPNLVLNEEPVSTTFTPEEELSNQTFRNQLDFMVKTLSGNHRKAFEMAVLKGMSYKQISALTGWSLSTVKINVYRARKQVATGMKGYI